MIDVSLILYQSCSFYAKLVKNVKFVKSRNYALLSCQPELFLESNSHKYTKKTNKIVLN